jgi:PAS domain S-box-containing protein
VRAPWVGALLAVASATAAFALTLALDLERLPFLIPMLAVLVSALYGGFGSGLLAGVVTIAYVSYALVEPRGAFRWPSLADAYHLGMFAVVAAVISLLASRRNRAEATMAATITSIGDGVLVTNVDGRITFVNAIAEQITGWNAADARGCPITDVIRIVNEDTRKPVPSLLERALHDSASPHVEERALLIARGGSELPVSATATAVRDARGEVIGAVLVVRDASHQRHVERALREQAAERERLLEREHAARQQAEEANRLKDEFVATLSHELRTPLNAVLGWVHMLIGRTLSDEEQAKALSAIQRNAQAQARLVDDILDLSRIVTGRLALDLQPVDVTDVVRSAAEAVAPAALAKHQQLALELPAEAVVTGDQHRLRQVAGNLLSNATKFTPEHGTIRARVTQADGSVELTVSDTGQGIDPAFLPFVFEPFRQADGSSTRLHAGLGLGLTLVRQLVEAHGGTVAALSEGINRGTTIIVRLPAAEGSGGTVHNLVSAVRQ